MILGVKLKQGIEWLNNFKKHRHSSHVLAQMYKADVIPNGEGCPVIITLVNSSASALLDEYLNSDDASILLSKENIPILAAALKDIVVFGQSAANSRHELVEMLVPALVGQHYVLRNHQALESSLSRCSQWPLERKAILPYVFQLSVPSPGAQNVCRYMQPSLAAPAGGEKERGGDSPPDKTARRDESGTQQTDKQGQGTSHVPESSDQEDEKRQQPGTTFEMMDIQSHVCFMTYLASDEDRSPCEGDLSTIQELVQEEIPADSENTATGIVNMADLVLSRGAGVFNWQNQDLTNMYICKKHKTELGKVGRAWKLTWSRIKKGGKRDIKCMMPPNVSGFTEHQRRPAHRPQEESTREIQTISKMESHAILRYKDVLIKVGTRKFIFCSCTIS